MVNQAKLIHSVHKLKLGEVLSNGLKAVSAFSDVGLEVRQNVVYCWLCKEDDRLAVGGAQ